LEISQHFKLSYFSTIGNKTVERFIFYSLKKIISSQLSIFMIWQLLDLASNNQF